MKFSRPMLLVAGALIAGPAVFGDARASDNPLVEVLVQKVVSRVDLDNDDRVTRAELNKAAETRFAAADANRDRLLNRDEFRTAYIGELGQLGLPWAEQVFQSVDRDGDGLLSRDEVAAAGGSIFAFADRDGDGEVTAAEVQAGLGPAP